MLGALSDSDIKLLRLFYVVARCGGFSAAQAQLNLSQSAISTRMAQLEARLGCRLCERGRGTFRLTEYGQEVIEASETLFAALEDFRSAIAESHSTLVGELRLGLIDNSVTHDDTRVRDAIAAFVASAPGTTLAVYVGGAVEIEQQVLDGRLHVGVGLFHHRLEQLSYMSLFEEEHLLYCAAPHPLFDVPDGRISPEQLQASRYASWGNAESLPGWHPPFPFREAAASPYVEGIAYLVLSGAYVGYLPSHYARRWVLEGTMRPLLPDVTRRSVEFALVRKRSSRASRLEQRFVESLLSVRHRD